MKKYVIIVIGPQGSGKGTQSRLLAEKLKLKFAEMGRMLNSCDAFSGDECSKIKKLIKKGELVPDEYIFKALKQEFEEKRGLILDGVPRNDEQAEKVIKLSKEHNFELLVLLLELPEEESITRLTARLVCPVCGYTPPYPEVLTKTHCDKCRSELIKREDDREEVIKERLYEYHQETEPMIKHLENAGIKVYRFDGKPKVPFIHKNIMKKMEEIGVAK